MSGDLYCFFGLHDWFYGYFENILLNSSRWERHCRCCGKKQYRYYGFFSKKWIDFNN